MFNGDTGNRQSISFRAGEMSNHSSISSRGKFPVGGGGMVGMRNKAPAISGCGGGGGGGGSHAQAQAQAHAHGLPLNSIPGLNPDVELAVEWSSEEQAILEDGLSKMVDAKRRLPSWMSCTTTPIPTPENHKVDNVAEKEGTRKLIKKPQLVGDEENHKVDNGAEKKGTRKLIKKSQLVGDEEDHKVDNGAEKKGTRKLIKKAQLVGDEENHKVDNGAEKKGTRKLIKEHQFVGNEDDFSLPDKKKRRTKKQVEAQTNPKIHPPKKDNAEEEDGYDDEEELTVDDLISIAREYVNADARKEHELGATIESVKQITATSVMSSKDLEGSTFRSEVVPTTHTSTCQEHSAEEETIHKLIRTGDPAQDMLDLFLGPLLKKTNVEVTNREIYKEDILMDHNLQKLSQKEESEKQLPTLMKKKSSLRDKVAMLLD